MDWDEIKMTHVHLLNYFLSLFFRDNDQVIVAGYSVMVARRLETKLHQVNPQPSYLTTGCTTFSHYGL